MDDIYEMFAEQAIKLAVVNSEVENLKQQVAEKDQRIQTSYAEATRASIREERGEG